MYTKDETILKRKITICKCPKCEKIHKLYMKWTGTGTPRFMCTSCKKSKIHTYNDGDNE